MSSDAKVADQSAGPLKMGIISANWGVKCHLPAWRAVDGIEVSPS